MIATLKLPFNFDAAALREDLRNFVPEDWTPHFNTGYYQGDWSGIALREAANSPMSLYPDPAADHYVDGAALKRAPAAAQVIESFKCTTESVRFLRLGAGAVIREHRDYKTSLEDGYARVHIPVQTNPEVEFLLNHERVEMNEGEAWYLNFNLPHSVKNAGSGERIHLVVDLLVNDWFRSFFPSAD